VSHTVCVDAYGPDAYGPDGPDQKHPCMPSIAKPRNEARTSDLNIIVYFLCSHHARLEHAPQSKNRSSSNRGVLRGTRSAESISEEFVTFQCLVARLSKAPSMRPAALFALP